MVTNFNRLVSVILIAMKEKDIPELGNITRLDEQNIWYIISNLYHGKTNSKYKEAYTLYKYWIRNKNKILERLTIEEQDVIMNEDIETSNDELMETCETDHDLIDSFLYHSSNNNKKNSFSTKIILEKFDYEFLMSCMSKSNGKQPVIYFKTKFDDFISDKLQEQGFNCRIRCINNRFNYKSLNPKNYWSGRYYCVENNCKNKFYAVIKEPIIFGLKTIVNIAFDEKGAHPLVAFKEKYSGEERESLELKIRAYGASQVRTQTIIENFEYKNSMKPPDRKKLAYIKYRSVHENKLENNALHDLEASRVWSDASCIQPTTNSLKGYIRNCSTHPYGCILLSAIQLIMWKKIRIKYPIIYFDATGGIVKNISNQKIVLLYLLTAHDKDKHVIVPIAEFLTTSHTQENISNNLFAINNCMHESMSQEAFILITDCSWALINSGCLVFNKCTVSSYISWTYELLKYPQNKQLQNVNKTIIYICSVHFLKVIFKHAEPILKVLGKETSDVFKFTFTLIQNSINIQQMAIYFRQFFKIFKFPKFDQAVKDSVIFINFELKTRNLEKNSIVESLLELPGQKEHQKFKDILDKENKQTFYNQNIENKRESREKKSPFLDFFNEEVQKIKYSDEYIKNKTSQIINPFYSPKLFQIVYNYLYLTPLWTGIMLHQFKLLYPDKCAHIISKEDNNKVESHINEKKTFIFQRKNLTISEFSSINYNHIKAIYIEKYENLNKHQLNKEKYNKKEIKEKWNKKALVKRIKNFYYKNYANFGNNKKLGQFLSTDFSNKDGAYTTSILNRLNATKKMNKKPQTQSIISQFFCGEIKATYTKLVDSHPNFEIVKTTLNQIRKKIEHFISFLKNNECQAYEEQLKDVCYENFAEKFNLKNFFALKVLRDGNCFYNTLSVLFFNKEYYAIQIKMACIFTILKNESFFKKLMQNTLHEDTLESFVLKMMRKNEYATELIILSCSILLNKPIYIFTLYPEEKKIINGKFVTSSENLHIYLYKTNNITQKPSQVMIGYQSFHFFPLVAEKKDTGNFSDLSVEIKPFFSEKILPDL